VIKVSITEILIHVIYHKEYLIESIMQKHNFFIEEDLDSFNRKASIELMD
jgi:hypothetical protein